MDEQDKHHAPDHPGLIPQGNGSADPLADRAETQRLNDDIKSRETPELIDKITEVQQTIAADVLSAEPEQQLPPGVTPEVLAAATAMERKAGPVVRQVLGTVLRGLLVSSPRVPPHVLLAVVAWQTGNLLAGAFQADIATTLNMRKSLKDGFADGVSKAPIVTPPMPGMPAKLNGH